MITWAFAYMHVNGPHPIDGMTFCAVIFVDLFIFAMFAGAIRCKDDKKEK